MVKEFLNKNKHLIKNLIQTTAVGLGFGIVVLVISVVISDVLYHEKKLLKRGYQIVIRAPGEKAPEVKKVDIATLMKTADAAAGAKVFKKCSSCHTEKQGGGNKVGPNLYGIVGKQIGKTSGFSYSAAIAGKGGSWTLENLDQWLANPKNFAPGTKMAFAGLKKDKDRANVIAYLKSQK